MFIGIGLALSNFKNKLTVFTTGNAIRLLQGGYILQLGDTLDTSFILDTSLLDTYNGHLINSLALLDSTFILDTSVIL